MINLLTVSNKNIYINGKVIDRYLQSLENVIFCGTFGSLYRDNVLVFEILDLGVSDIVLNNLKSNLKKRYRCIDENHYYNKHYTFEINNTKVIIACR